MRRLIFPGNPSYHIDFHELPAAADLFEKRGSAVWLDFAYGTKDADEPTDIGCNSGCPADYFGVPEGRRREAGGSIVVERVFQQGSIVKEGDVLYRIDPAPFRVRVESAAATLKRAQATHLQARQQSDRIVELRERNVASVQQQESATAALAQADADVALAQAALDEAKINLEYTEVRAPITGIIGGALVTEGALVTADGTQNLALIQQVDPVYADFTQSAQDLLTLKRAVKQESWKARRRDRPVSNSFSTAVMSMATPESCCSQAPASMRPPVR
jgi:biotin carboxyl carrier protein